MMKRTDTRTSIRRAGAALLAAAVLAVLAAAQTPPPPPGRPGPRAARAIADLGLTPDQVKALGEFRKARMNERLAFREEMGRFRGEMRALAGDPQANQGKIDKLIDQRARLRADREKGALRARAERDNIFTPEQRDKIRAFRSGRQGRMGLAGPGRMARPWAYRYRPHPGWRRGWVRGWRHW
jgi:Spy/CpxP family protein refolding chaperone